MAGIIVFESGDWHISGSGFRAMASGLLNHLPDTSAAAALRGELRLAVDSQLYFIDTTGEFSIAMLAEFLQGANAYLRDLKSQGKAEFGDSELYDGHLGRIIELVSRLNRAINPPCDNSML